jgi:hypothetical protein
MSPGIGGCGDHVEIEESAQHPHDRFHLFPTLQGNDQIRPAQLCLVVFQGLTGDT